MVLGLFADGDCGVSVALRASEKLKRYAEEGVVCDRRLCEEEG
jgi:hypothetical protein